MLPSSCFPAFTHNAALSIAVVSSDRRHRIAASGALAKCGNVQVREFTAHPFNTDEVRRLREALFDIVLIDLDADPEGAIAVVGQVCHGDAAIAMVFSERADPGLMLRSMRAGAREFFILPFKQEAIVKALHWVAAHRQPAPEEKRTEGHLLVFFGSKGGVGVTTVATNFAVAVAQESGQSTLLIDLNFHLGDAARNLGINPEGSAVDALENAARLDGGLLRRYLTVYGTGLSVLAAPARIPAARPTNEAIGKLLAAARQEFDNVVVDAGKKIDLRQMHLFDVDATTYLVTQVGIPELRNANRLITQFSGDACPKLEIVINRHQSRFLGLTDEHLNKALTRPVGWKIPNDFKAVRQMETSGVPPVDQDLPIASVIRRMARAACGLGPPKSSAPSRVLAKTGVRMPWKAASQGIHAEAAGRKAQQPLPRAAR